MAGTPPSTPSDGIVRLTPVNPATAPRLADLAAPVSPPRVVGAAVEVAAGTEIKKAEFIERVMARANLRKREAKTAIEATLAELADLLAGGAELNVPPVGKMKAVKVKDLDGGARLLTVKLRTAKAGSGTGAGASGDAPDDGADADDATPAGQPAPRGKGRQGKVRPVKAGGAKNAKSGVADDGDDG